MAPKNAYFPPNDVVLKSTFGILTFKTTKTYEFIFQKNIFRNCLSCSPHSDCQTVRLGHTQFSIQATMGLRRAARVDRNSTTGVGLLFFVGALIKPLLGSIRPC